MSDLIKDDENLMVIFGSGGTISRIGAHLELGLTLLGIDIYHNGEVFTDLNEQQLLEKIEPHDGEKLRFFHQWGAKGSSLAVEIYGYLPTY